MFLAGAIQDLPQGAPEPEQENGTPEIEGEPGIVSTPETEGVSGGNAGPEETTEPVQTTQPSEPEQRTDTGAWTTQPVFSVGNFQVTNGMLAAGLALVLVILICAIFLGRKHKAAARTARTETEGTQQNTQPNGPAVSTVPTQPQEPDAASAPPAPRRGVRASYHQHIGARKDQQDSCVYSDPAAYSARGMLAVVADGMGGLANGQAVSSTLARVCIEGFQYANPQQDGADLLLELAIRANAQVNAMLRGQERSGSTLVAALVRGGYLHFLTVGDSRIYLYRGGALIQLNREHIYMEELAVKAVNQSLAPSQVRSDRQAHALTSYFGIGRIPAIDRNMEGIKLIEGDRILLASDGVFGTLSAAQLEEALRHNVKEAAAMIGDRIRAADKPYQDNNTAVILEYIG